MRNVLKYFDLNERTTRAKREYKRDELGIYGIEHVFKTFENAIKQSGLPNNSCESIVSNVLVELSIGPEISIEFVKKIAGGVTEKQAEGVTEKQAIHIDEPRFETKQQLPMFETKQQFQKILSVCDQIEMYFGILIGVILSSVISEYKVTNAIGFNSFDIPFFLLSSVIALIVSPYAYEKLSIEPAAPFIVRFGLFVQQGVFWKTIIGAFKY